MLRPEDAKFASIRHMMLLAGPLILSHMSFMLMNLVDGLFISRYSELAIAAIGPSGMAFWLLIGIFVGLCGYTGTFVAQYVGAQRAKRVGAAVWQGMYLAVASGVMIAMLTPITGNIFIWAGHAPVVAELERTYFQIMCWGASLFLLSSALSGFFAGRHDNLTLMVVHICGGIINAVLDYVLIFGYWGFPEMGMAGAAWATVIAHGFIVLAFFVLFLQRRHQHDFGTWVDRPFGFVAHVAIVSFRLAQRY